METLSPKGVTMGLFTNRKREVEDDTVRSSDAIRAVEPSWIDEPAPPMPEPVDEHENAAADQGWFAAAAPDPLPDRAAPFTDPAPSDTVGADHEAERALAEFGITLAETEPAVPPAPRRSLTDHPVGTVHAGNVEIDARGLLDMLGVTPAATLMDISEARLRFLAEHDPAAEDDPEAARIKERIRRRVNTAYASFRLTLAD